jgi:hypothetical protein
MAPSGVRGLPVLDLRVTDSNSARRTLNHDGRRNGDPRGSGSAEPPCSAVIRTRAN